MHDLTIIDETFDINITHNYNLSVQVLPDSLSFSVYNGLQSKFIALKHFDLGKKISPDDYLEKIKHIIIAEEILQKKYKSIKILVFSSCFTLIPGPLFQEEEREEYFNLGNKADETIILTNSYKSFDAVVVFSISKFLFNMLSSFFNTVVFYHQSVPMIDENLIQYKNKLTTPRVFINTYSEYCDICVLKDNRPELFNCFRFENGADFMFYLMYIYEHLKLDPENISLTISGDFERKSELSLNMEKFIKNISFSGFPKNFMFSYHYKKIEEHLFTNLYLLEKCE